MSIDVNGSSQSLSANVQISVKVKLASASGNVLASNTFPGRRSGNKIYASDPGAVASWINNSNVPYEKVITETYVDGITVTEGLNTFMATSQYNGINIETRGVVWSSDACEGPSGPPYDESDCL